MRGFALAVLVLLPGTAALAQDAGPARVRVHLAGAEVVQGFLRGQSSDEMVVYTRDRAFRRVPLRDIRAFEVRQRTGTHWKRGAFIGTVVWLSAMKIAAVPALERAGLVSWQSGAILAGSAGLGAGIGAAIPRYGWREADPRSLAGTPRPGAGVEVTLRF